MVDNPEVCPRCQGDGMLVVEKNGRSMAEPCDCRQQLKVNSLLRRAQIPENYAHCTLESYDPGSELSLQQARLIATRFVDFYPHASQGKGLLLTGSIGVGKTYLAVGILRSLILEKGVPGLFCGYSELLKQIQNSYSAQAATTELQLLAPVFNAEVLVLDDLGSTRPTDWIWDTVALILNTRYNDKKTTLITTNYGDALGDARAARNQAERAMREQTLADRIGERMRSRLAEMCVRVEMLGADRRQGAYKARLG